MWGHSFTCTCWVLLWHQMLLMKMETRGKETEMVIVVSCDVWLQSDITESLVTAGLTSPHCGWLWNDTLAWLLSMHVRKILTTEISKKTLVIIPGCGVGLGGLCVCPYVTWCLRMSSSGPRCLVRKTGTFARTCWMCGCIGRLVSTKLQSNACTICILQHRIICS